MNKIISGRPSYDDNQYKSWLQDMKPFLKNGASLYFSIQKAGLSKQKDSIYRKYRLNDWFCEKIIHFQTYPGELTNMILVARLKALYQEVIQGKPLNKTDVKLWKTAVNKHRSCQPFFMTKKYENKNKLFKVSSLKESINSMK